MEAVTHTENRTALLLYASPFGVGYFALSLSLLLMSLRFTGLLDYTSSAVICSLALFYGGIAQIGSGLLAFFKGDTFAFTTFVSIGFFFISWTYIQFLPFMGNTGLAVQPAPASMATFFFAWAFVIASFVLSSRGRDRISQIMYSLLVVWMIVIGMAFVCMEVPALRDDAKVCFQIAGFEGFLVALLAWYLGSADMNGWPTFPMNRPLKEQVADLFRNFHCFPSLRASDTQNEKNNKNNDDLESQQSNMTKEGDHRGGQPHQGRLTAIAHDNVDDGRKMERKREHEFRESSAPITSQSRHGPPLNMMIPQQEHHHNYDAQQHRDDELRSYNCDASEEKTAENQSAKSELDEHAMTSPEQNHHDARRRAVDGDVNPLGISNSSLQHSRQVLRPVAHDLFP